MRKRILLGASLPEGGPPGTDGWGRRGRRGEEEEGGERTAEGRGGEEEEGERAAEGRGEEEGGDRERKCSFGVYMCITIMYFLKDELLLYRFVFVVFLYKNPEAIYCMHCIMLKSAVCVCVCVTYHCLMLLALGWRVWAEAAVGKVL